MKTTLHFTKQIITLSVIFFLPFAISAQDVKKEVHVKIIEDGVVTQDTVYAMSGEFHDTDEFVEMEKHQGTQGKKHIIEKTVTIMNDSVVTEETTLKEGGRNKEVRVTVHTGDEDGDSKEVEEIWIDGDGSTCRTIIIHEGDCKGGKVKDGHMRGEKDGPEHKVEKKVIKTGGGEKVIIVETTDDEPVKGKKN